MNLKTFIILLLALTVLASSGCAGFRSEGAQKESTDFSLNSFPVKYASVNGVELGYREFGSGEPILLIMGFGGTMDMWNATFVELLAQDYRVISFDNRGIGFSSDDGEPFSLDLLAGDAAGLLDALGIQQAHVLGTSMGASVAQEMALNYPEKVDKLVFSSATYSVNTPETALLKDLLQSCAANSGLDPAVRKQADANLKWNGTYERLPEIRSKTLLLVGTDDEFTPPVITLEIAENLPGAQFIVFEGAKHCGERYLPVEYSNAVLDFLNEEESSKLK
ncbi:alpha/beta fold hydrolase [Methanosarcina sp. KYL-1]|uniref:alpha/beta fold hydrolase n=1 Tax=Methanosarcina sp. KYL-1 TaxID=2602068 RepID=UPI002100DEF3|nr:alpha/beta hydrolase [Methanosarcina sp. KYL-1]